jgi:hypothetical protein
VQIDRERPVAEFEDQPLALHRRGCRQPQRRS